MKNKSLARKIMLVYALFLCGVIAFLLAYSISIVSSMHLKIIKREMVSKLEMVELFLNEEKKFGHDSARAAEVIRKSAKMIGLRLTVIDLKGKVLADSEAADVSTMDNHLYREEVLASARETYGFSSRRSSTVNYDTLYCVKKADNYYIRIAKPLNEINQSIAAVRRGVLFSGFCLAMVSLVLMFFLSRKISRPIRETEEFARQFSTGDLASRIQNYSDDEIGHVQRALNTMADTIENKIKDISAEGEKFYTTLENIPDGIALVSSDKKILFMNNAFKKIYGVIHSPEGLLYFESIRSRMMNSHIDSMFLNKKTSHFEDDSPSGFMYNVKLTMVNEEGVPKSVLAVVHDVTEARKIERIKADLVGNMSHELKTPIAIMKGYLETIRENLNSGEECRAMIDKAVENADRQTSIINDILKLHRMERSGEFILEDMSIEELINNCVNIIKPKAVEKDILFSSEFTSIPKYIRGNRFLAEEIFFNLIDNAVNYNNPRGHIAITSTKDEKNYYVHVEDTGIGIPNESLSRIFERFYRVDKSRSRDTGGTGLGLSIVKHAAELMGWDVTAKALERGSCFTVVIPVKPNNA